MMIKKFMTVVTIFWCVQTIGMKEDSKLSKEKEEEDRKLLSTITDWKSFAEVAMRLKIHILSEQYGGAHCSLLEPSITLFSKFFSDENIDKRLLTGAIMSVRSENIPSFLGMLDNIEKKDKFLTFFLEKETLVVKAYKKESDKPVFFKGYNEAPDKKSFLKNYKESFKESFLEKNKNWFFGLAAGTIGVAGGLLHQYLKKTEPQSEEAEQK
jgi:hypothetical protein